LNVQAFNPFFLSAPAAVCVFCRVVGAIGLRSPGPSDGVARFARWGKAECAPFEDCRSALTVQDVASRHSSKHIFQLIQAWARRPTAWSGLGHRRPAGLSDACLACGCREFVLPTVASLQVVPFMQRR